MGIPKIGYMGYNTDYLGMRINYIASSTFDKAVEKLSKAGIPVDGSRGKNASLRFPHVHTIPQVKGSKINVFDVKSVLSAFGIKNANLPETHEYHLFVNKTGSKGFDICDKSTKGDCLVFSAERNFRSMGDLLALSITKPILSMKKFFPKPSVAPKRTDLACEVIQKSANSPKEIRVLPSCIAKK